MGSRLMPLICEMHLINDAINDIGRIFKALAKCHGDEYRALERRIEDIAGGGKVSRSEVHWLDPERCMLEPPIELKEIIHEARRLEVI